MSTPVILSYGLGVDSTAILLRWITDPTSRDFDLADLTVVTAMTGDEWEQSGELVEAHVLPLLREHSIRYVQVARGGLHIEDGVTILSDTNAPERVYLAGDYKLSDEMLAGGTVPQVGGARLCSQKAKGQPLDHIIERLVGGKHVAFRHVMGFEAEEPGRAAKDTLVGSKKLTGRVGEYPLIEWGWDRARCEQFITEVTGATWLKSACVFCPFAISSKAGIERIMPQYREHPAQAAQALFVEHVALLFNERQSLAANKRLVDLIREDGNQAALDALDARIAATPHALYRVRRLGQLREDGKLNWHRSVQRVSAPERLVSAHDAEGQVDVTRTREQATASAKYVAAEEVYVIAPAVVADKAKPDFEAWWAEAVA